MIWLCLGPPPTGNAKFTLNLSEAHDHHGWALNLSLIIDFFLNLKNRQLTRLGREALIRRAGWDPPLPPLWKACNKDSVCFVLLTGYDSFFEKAQKCREQEYKDCTKLKFLGFPSSSTPEMKVTPEKGDHLCKSVQWAYRVCVSHFFHVSVFLCEQSC